MWTCQIFLALIVTAQHSLCKKTPERNVIFYSKNFRNILLWNLSRNRHQSDTFYNVQYKIYGEPWFNKSECHKITEEYCDLTNETGDVSERYVARVMAESRNGSLFWSISSRRFSPKKDTHLGAPLIRYTEGVTSVLLQIQPPFTPLISKDGSPQSIENIYEKDRTKYYIVLRSHGGKKENRDWKTNSKDIEITKLLPETEYCVNVTIIVTSIGKESDRKAFCFKTLPGHDWLFLILIAFVFFIGMTTTATIYAIMKYIKKQPRMPKTLQNFLPHNHRRLSANAHMDNFVSIEYFRRESTSPLLITEIPGIDPLLKPSSPSLKATHQPDQTPLSFISSESNDYAPQVLTKSYGTSLETKDILLQRNGRQPDLSSVTTNFRKEVSPENSHVKCKSRVSYALLLPPTPQQSGYMPQITQCSQNGSDDSFQVTYGKWKTVDTNVEFCPEQHDKASVETLTNYKRQMHFSPVQLKNVTSVAEPLASPGYKLTGQLVLETECRNGKLYLPVQCFLLENDDKANKSSDQTDCILEAGDTLSLLPSVLVNGALFAEDDVIEDEL